MDYATLKREAAKYPDTMTSMERMKAYAMGEVVDHIPFSTGGPDSFVHLYGYTLGEYRRSMDVQFDVAEQAKREFGGSGMQTPIFPCVEWEKQSAQRWYTLKIAPITSVSMF